MNLVDSLVIWALLIVVAALLGWLACNHFWKYYAMFKHLFWGCLMLLFGLLSYDYGVYRGAWAVQDVYQGVPEVRNLESPSNGHNLSIAPSKAQEDAKVPFLYDALVAGFLMYCVLMLLVGGKIVTNSAKKTGPKALARDGLLDNNGPALSR
jgi:hypothetical protein